MAQAAPDGLKGLRDQALLLLGFAGAFRRSELVALDIMDLEETDEGMRVAIRRSKTDQDHRGSIVPIDDKGGQRWELAADCKDLRSSTGAE
jgi:site-specific recombinase XerD